MEEKDTIKNTDTETGSKEQGETDKKDEYEKHHAPDASVSAGR